MLKSWQLSYVDSYGNHKDRHLVSQNFSSTWMSRSVQFLSRVRLFATRWIAALQASLSNTNSWSLLRLMSIESVMPSSHFILCRPLLLLPPVHPSISVFSNESALHMRWPKYWMSECLNTWMSKTLQIMKMILFIIKCVLDIS